MKLVAVLFIFVSLSLVFATGCAQNSSVVAIKADNKPTTTKPAETAEDIARITPKEAKDTVEAGKAIIIDTRPAEAYKAEHIKGSINIPLGEAENRINELPKNKQLIFYCS